jgi:hypothetical protein
MFVDRVDGFSDYAVVRIVRKTANLADERFRQIPVRSDEDSGSPLNGIGRG